MHLHCLWGLYRTLALTLPQIITETINPYQKTFTMVCIGRFLGSMLVWKRIRNALTILCCDQRVVFQFCAVISEWFSTFFYRSGGIFGMRFASFRPETWPFCSVLSVLMYSGGVPIFSGITERILTAQRVYNFSANTCGVHCQLLARN